MYFISLGFGNKMSSKDFNSAAKALFVSKGYQTKDSHYHYEGSVRKHARNVAFGTEAEEDLSSVHYRLCIDQSEALKGLRSQFRLVKRKSVVDTRIKSLCVKNI